jgi:hypothetical protein
MDSVEKILIDHEPWYDSSDQNMDSWGCRCNRQTGYRTREEVIAKHIMPKVRAAQTGEPELRPQKDANGNQQRMDANGRLLRANTEAHVWENYDKLVEYTKGVGLTKITAALEEYEEERLRTIKVVKNLDDQLAQLSAGLRKNADEFTKLKEILARADLDLEVILATDEVFAEPEVATMRSVTVLGPGGVTAASGGSGGGVVMSGTASVGGSAGSIVYCTHGNDMTQSCTRCGRW